MKFYLLYLFQISSIIALGQSNTVIISGTVTDFNNSPIGGALVMLKGSNFGEFTDTTYSDNHGKYSLVVEKGKYSGLAAVKMEDYGKSKLEFWAYEIPAHENLQINIRYDRLEVYGVNIFQVKGAYPGYMIYFRPMSLTRFATIDPAARVIDIAPPKDRIKVIININGEKVKINSIQRIEEYAGNQIMYGYLIQADEGKEKEGGFTEFHIIVEDQENGDIGEALYFKEKPEYSN